MDTRTEPIRQDIDAIRDSMTEKMEQIESKVRGTVEDTTSTLRQTFDLKYQVGERPWAALGLSVLVGYALGSMGEDDRSHGYTSHRDMPFYSRTSEYTQPQSSTNGGNGSTGTAHAYTEPKKPAEPGFLDSISDQFGDELHLLKGAAIASVVGLIRDTLKQSLPGVYQEMERARGTQSQRSSSSPTYYESIGASEDPNRRAQGPTGTHESESSYRSPYATS